MSDSTNKNLVVPSFSPTQPEESGQSQDNEDSHGEELASSADEPLDYISDGIASLQHGTWQNRGQKSDSDLDSHASQSDGHSSPTDGFYPSELPSPPRPNKYHGPPSTWRNWTAAERELAASLDQLDAKDLAVHLFNAFALKRRAGRLGRSKGQSTRNDDGTNRYQEWVPPSIWTAWPLMPDNVPRQRNDLHWETDRYICSNQDITGQAKQSELMEEILIGRILNKAKQGFWKWKRDNPEIPESIDASKSNSHASPDYQESADSREAEPVFLADDGIAREILRPTIYHVLKKLDDLLVGLHHARTASMISEKSAGEPQNEALTEPDDSKPHKSRVGNTRSRGDGREPQSSKVSTASETNLGSSDQQRFSAARKRRKSRSNSRYARRLQQNKGRGLRDWSDIVGIAMMTGWDSKSVNRAAIRCAALFEEEIMLRTLKEDGDSVLINAGTVQAGDMEADSNATTRVPDARRLARRSGRTFCPVTDCNCSITGFSSAYTLKRHVNRFHKNLNISTGLSAEIVKSEHEMHGGVHVDGYLQPVTTKIRSQRGRRSRRSNL